MFLALGYALLMPQRTFGPFVLDADAGLLSSEGNPLAINQRGMAILETLLAAQGKTVTKSDLMERVWPGQIVEDGNLTVQIATLRKVLGERPDGTAWIITVPRLGYRMIAQSHSPDPKSSIAQAPSPEKLEKEVLPSLAVLPFSNLSGDPEQDYFADGIVEDIITALSRFKSFAVVARNSSFTYKGRAVDVRQVAKELGVRYILEGSVRRSGGKLRITAQLVDSAGGAHLWAQNFDGVLDEVFDFQDQITASVSMVVEPGIQAAELERSRRDRPASIAVYDLFLRAQTALYTAEAHAQALELISEALGLEPRNARVLALAASLLSAKTVLGGAPILSEDRKLCAEWARRGLQNAGGDAAVMADCALALAQTAWEYDLAMAAIKPAVEANPNDMTVVASAGVLNLHCGDVRTALAYFHRASQLSPRDPRASWILTGIAHAHMILGDYTEALVWAMRSRALSPDYACNLWMLIAANAHLGRMDEARRFLAELRTVAPGITVSRIWAGQSQKDPSRMANILEGLRLAGLE